MLTALALIVVYLIGPTRSGGAFAAASTFAKTVNSSPSQPSRIPVVGGPGITVGGSALVAGTSDTVLLDLSVVATASSVSEALASANLSADAVQTSLLGNGVAKKDLQTSGLEVQPNYDYSNKGTPRLTGYQVSESVSAKLRSLGRAGDAIGKAVSAGGNAVRSTGSASTLRTPARWCPAPGTRPSRTPRPRPSSTPRTQGAPSVTS